MTIDTRDHLIAALANTNTRLLWAKDSITGQLAGQYTSMWRATGQPGQGAIPAAAAYCTSALAGAVPFPNQIAPATSYLGHHTLVCGTANTSAEIHDRIAHMGGLNGTLITAQAVTIDLNTINAGGAIPAARRGAANFSEVMWLLEWYNTTGPTASNATVNVTYDDDSTGNLAVIAVGGSIVASQCRQLLPAVPGRFIRAVNNVTLSASTGTAGSIGVTATRQRAAMHAPLANAVVDLDWARLGLTNVPNDSCLFLMLISTGSTTGTIRGQTVLAHG